MIHRKSTGKRMAAKLKEIRATLRQRLHRSLADTIKWLQSVVRGYFQYHAIPGNEVRLRAFRHDVLRLWMRQLRRRSRFRASDQRQEENDDERGGTGSATSHPGVVAVIPSTSSSPPYS